MLNTKSNYRNDFITHHRWSYWNFLGSLVNSEKDIMAQATCVALATEEGWIFAVQRPCPTSVNCQEICSSPGLQLQGDPHIFNTYVWFPTDKVQYLYMINFYKNLTPSILQIKTISRYFIFRGSCFNALHVYNNTALGGPGMLGPKIYRFNKCDTNPSHSIGSNLRCDISPNYCCCTFAPVEDEWEVEKICNVYGMSCINLVIVKGNIVTKYNRRKYILTLLI